MGPSPPRAPKAPLGPLGSPWVPFGPLGSRGSPWVPLAPMAPFWCSSPLYCLEWNLFSEPRFRAGGGSDRAIISRSPMQMEGFMPTPDDKQLYLDATQEVDNSTSAR